ncbi:MAG: sugar ABC transporter ATP-binding protein [Anaerolineae bacterium]|nr:sugar ABC transporter ATP-binding protein [Anaerolineae bacterium]
MTNNASSSAAISSTIADSPSEPILQMIGISKSFPGVQALSNVSFDLHKGEVHALLGENGAGKSTLTKILSGVYTRDSGEIIFKGKQVSFSTPRQAQLAGITTIYQELNQIPQLSVAENIFLGNEQERGFLIDWKTMREEATRLLARLHLKVDPRTPVSQLGVGQQQMVEVARALHHKSDIIIMDEPTSALSIQEIDDLFEIIRQLKASGVAIIYISHHLEESFQIGDRITVLRDGHLVTTRPTSEMTLETLISAMVGRSLSEQFPKEEVQRGAEVLRVEGLSQGDKLHDISFSVHAGEMLGIAGLVGAGRTELVRAIFGADPITAGKFYVDGREIRISSPRDAIRHGIALLTEDRKQQGLLLQMSVRENISLSVLGRLTRGLFTNRQVESDLAGKYIRELSIRTPSQLQQVINLSGGNQQKVILGKWISTAPRVLIFDEPTRGIDVGAKAEIYKLMNQLAKQGVAIIVVSSEMPEILGMSDRIMVICEGYVTGFLSHAEATQEKVMELATAHRGVEEQRNNHNTRDNQHAASSGTA